MANKPTYEELEQRVRNLEKRDSERKRANEALRESEERFRRLFEGHSAIKMIIDPDTGDIIDANGTAAVFYGWSVEELRQMSIQQINTMPTEAVKREMEKARSQDGLVFEFRHRRSDGTIRDVEVFSNKVEITGKALLYSIIHDITDRKQAEEALQGSEEKLRLLVENANDAIFVAQDGVIKRPNAKTEEMIGYSAEELEKTPFANHLHPDDKENVLERHKRRLEGEDLVSGYSFRVIRKTGEELWVNFNTVLTTWEGRPATLNFVRDITEGKRLEAQLEQANKMKAVAILAGGVAHEFNNTLMGIMGNIELLKMNFSEDEELDKHLESMKSAGHRMSHLTSQLLAYAEGGKYQPKNLKLDDFVIETLQILEHDLNPTVRVETHFQKDISFINADNAQMQMVLSAILSNSNEAMEDNGLVKITAENKDVDDDFTKQHAGLKLGPYVCLTVEDDGRGMDEETRDGIFEPFFSTKFQGRGMGMAAVHGIVRNHDGWISVDSELGRGTKVQIYLPAIEVEVEKPKKADDTVTTGSGTILMIEDEDVVIEVAQAMLETLGYRVMVANTGKDAIHIAETFDGQIDLALLDIKLPDIDGRNLYPLIMKARSNLKVIVFSGYSIDGPAREILDAGAEGFIQKPFSLAALSEKLKVVSEGNGVQNHSGFWELRVKCWIACPSIANLSVARSQIADGRGDNLVECEKEEMKNRIARMAVGVLLTVFIFGPLSALAEEGKPLAPGEGTTVAHADKDEVDLFAASADVSFLSQYIWRGYELSKDSLVIQPSVTVGYKGFSLNLWGNFDTDCYEGPHKDNAKWNETDLTVAYETNFGPVGVGVGYLYYAVDGEDDTQEFYASVGGDVFLAPTFTVYRDVDEYHGWYFNLGISHSFDLPNRITLDLAGSVAYGISDNDSTMNYDNNLNETTDRFNNFQDGLVSVGLSIPFLKYFTAAPVIAYSFPLGNAADNMLKATSLSHSAAHLFGGVNLSVEF